MLNDQEVEYKLTLLAAKQPRTEVGKIMLQAAETISRLRAIGSLSRGWPRHWDRLTYTDRSFLDCLADGIDNVAALR
jgi:hypothetical protein